MDEESCKKGIRKIHLLSTPRSNDYNNLLDTMQAYSKRSLLSPFSTTKIEKLTKLRPSEEASFDWIELIRSWSEIANSTLIEAVVLLESLNDSLRTRDAARRRNYCRLVRGQGKWDLTDVPACESHSVALVPGVWLREEGGEGREGEARGVVISRQELWRLQKRIVSFPPPPPPPRGAQLFARFAFPRAFTSEPLFVPRGGEGEREEGKGSSRGFSRRVELSTSRVFNDIRRGEKTRCSTPPHRFVATHFCGGERARFLAPLTSERARKLFTRNRLEEAPILRFERGLDFFFINFTSYFKFVSMHDVKFFDFREFFFARTGFFQAG